uniref:Uncharacterized protein n=1 Tax=Chromera velia CCMP2878 TaxID=1169474 RepID=A0A0G4G0G1_9ALVE|eukprot:Cvel_509.t1-p1 / transcript=Cvel_509.t1 / gene=Cvel_509 / organism=Chromera_velia_CCMP2878 / gene_product=hypothetical protein / transcript_product=hypothetical protein / location=Cvel_scaffold16:17985-25411(-) / protein_length=68 / sequence_SO=supercontig / SO=protein_coding / is_pseudo=false
MSVDSRVPSVMEIRPVLLRNSWNPIATIRAQSGKDQSLNPLLLYDESINEFQKVTALQIPVHCTVPQR